MPRVYNSILTSCRSDKLAAQVFSLITNFIISTIFNNNVSNPHYSGFLSNFASSNSYSNTDILSTRTYSSHGTGGGSTYGASYFTIGNVLVQFTDVSNEEYMSIFGGTGAKTITFPVKFNGMPWCIVASPSSNDQESGQFTVITDTFTESSFNVYVVNDGTALTYIAIGSGPPGGPT